MISKGPEYLDTRGYKVYAGGPLSFFSGSFFPPQSSRIHPNLSRDVSYMDIVESRNRISYALDAGFSFWWKFGSLVTAAASEEGQKDHTPNTEADQCCTSKCLPGNPS